MHSTDCINILLDEPVHESLLREDEVARNITTARAPVVLYGAGNLGRKVATGLQRAGAVVSAFADRDPALHGTDILGSPILSPEDAVKLFAASASFFVTVWLSHGDGGMQTRIKSLRSLGCSSVLPFVQLCWGLPGVLPHFAVERPSFVLSHAAEIRRVAGLMADTHSMRVLGEQLAWRLTGTFEGLSAPEELQYFPQEVIMRNDNECFVDGGAFDGDTLASVPWNIKRAWAFDPDPVTAAKLRRSANERVTVIEAGLGRAPSRVRFNATGGLGSARSASGAVEVEIQTIDQALAGEAITFLKLDVEGDELDALRGAASTLQKHEPVVAVCVYHKPQDIWEIPLFLAEMLPRHKFYLRSHANDGFETVLYAVPPARCVSPSSSKGGR